MGLLDTLNNNALFNIGLGTLAAPDRAGTAQALVGGLDFANQQSTAGGRREQLGLLNQLRQNEVRQLPTVNSLRDQQLEAAIAANVARRQQQAAFSDPQNRELVPLDQQVGPIGPGGQAPTEVTNEVNVPQLINSLLKQPETAQTAIGLINALKTGTGSNVNVNVNTADKERVKDRIQEETDFQKKRVNTRNFVANINSVLQEVSKPGAKIGAVGGFIRGLQSLKSQFAQAVGPDGKIQASAFAEGTSQSTIDAVISAGISSDTVSLAFLLASQRESGKLTDKDFERAERTLAGGGQSIQQMMGNLLKTSTRQQDNFDREASIRQNQAIDEPGRSMFNPIVRERAFDIDQVKAFSDSDLRSLDLSLRGLSRSAVKSAFSQSALEEYARRITELKAGRR